MPEPKYRYFLVPPATVSLPAAEIVAILPAGSWQGTEADKRRTIALPAAEILATNTPRIRFSRMRDLMPGVQEPSDAPEWLSLPTTSIALAYKPDIRREEIPAEKPEPTADKPAPDEAAAQTKDVEPFKDTEPESTGEPAKPASPPALVDEASAETPKPKPIPAWKRLLKPTLAPPPDPTPAGPRQKGSPKSAGSDSGELAGPAAANRPLKPDDEASLRAMFMTDEDLTVGTLVDLCSKLPGVAGCELLAEGGVVKTSAMPSSFTPSAWMAPAREALSRMPGIPADMPVVTLHPPHAAVSLWLPAKLSFVVVHHERGYLPGVREKLDAVVAAIQRAMD